MTELCGCIKCQEARAQKAMDIWPLTLNGPGCPGWRYSCEICGNKRCPHHSDHALTCTGSNATGQAGSVYQ